LEIGKHPDSTRVSGMVGKRKVLNRPKEMSEKIAAVLLD
jgi:hypothetical protein